MNYLIEAETYLIEADEDLGAIEELRAQHLNLMNAVQALDTDGQIGDAVNGFHTRYHFYLGALGDALSDLEAIAEEINEELDSDLPDENAEHRLGAQLMGVR